MNQLKLTNYFAKSFSLSSLKSNNKSSRIAEKHCNTSEIITNIEPYYCMMFDGCSKGNPGPAGAGAVIYENNNEIWSQSVYVGCRKTNNYAEYSGLLLGLKEAVRRNIKVLIVKGDSEIVIKQMLGKYSVKSENLLNLNKQAKELERHFDKIFYFHVYRESNARADALSNEGLAKTIGI